jgi:hypothetical protein
LNRKSYSGVPGNAPGKRVHGTTVYFSPFSSQAFPQIMWKAELGKLLVFIPL